jgi:hypothetical protein
MDLLREVGEQHSKILALQYVEIAMRDLAEELSPLLVEATLNYLNAARLYLDEREIDRLEAARREFLLLQAEAKGDDQSDVWIAENAVAVACGREMRDAGIVKTGKLYSNIYDVARDAQKIVARRLVKENDPAQAKLIRWNMAQRQLILLIESAPYVK